ncbi:MAG: hypothetical protein ABIR35_08450 [Polaromonas sp.]
MAQSFKSASQNPAHKPPSRQHDKVRSVRLLVALALTLILAGIANTAAQGVNFQPATALPMAAPSQATRPAASAPEPDGIDSARCRRARGDLELALGEASDRQPDTASALALARQQAASACLGQANSHAAPASRWQPSLAIQPAQPIQPITPAGPAPAPVVRAAPLPPVAIPRASVISSCDAGGCWDSDGARLQRSGPNLIGPRGPCTPQGTLFNCP